MQLAMVGSLSFYTVLKLTHMYMYWSCTILVITDQQFNIAISKQINQELRY